MLSFYSSLSLAEPNGVKAHRRPRVVCAKLPCEEVCCGLLRQLGQVLRLHQPRPLPAEVSLAGVPAEVVGVLPREALEVEEGGVHGAIRVGRVEGERGDEDLVRDYGRLDAESVPAIFFIKNVLFVRIVCGCVFLDTS